MPNKRPGNQNRSTSNGTSAKKLKYQDDSDDDDYDKADLELKGTNRKNVNMDGYASDSSQGSDDGRPRSKGKKKGMGGSDDDNNINKGDDNEDGEGPYYYAPDETKERERMDGVDDEDEDEENEHRDFGIELRKGAPKKSAKANLELDDIEGQHFTKKKDQDDDDDDDNNDDELMNDEDDKANDDDAPRAKKKEGMGYAIEEFNMRKEMEEGRFTGEGVYTRNKADEFAAHDTWLEGVSSKAAIKAAKQAKERAEQLRRERDNNHDQWTKLSRAECMKEILNSALLCREETIMQALGRLGEQKKRLQKQFRQRSKNNHNKKSSAKGKEKMDVDEGENNTINNNDNNTSNTKLKTITSKIEKLSSLASNLLEKYGETDIYEESWINLVKDLRMDGEVPRGWEPQKTADDDKMDSDLQEGQNNNIENSSPSLISRPLISRPHNNESHPPSLPSHDKTPQPKFFYRWSELSGAPPEEREKSYGPFSYEDMDSWIQGQYFGPDAQNIQVSTVSTLSSVSQGSTPSGPWTSWNQALTTAASKLS